MLETFLLTVNEWIAGGPAIAAVGCFVWGMVSVVLSPCHLASIPLIVAYVGGQQRILRPREAGYYAAAFTSGLFITIALVGIICALLGRMLGDVGNYWQILIGLILIWVAMGMFGVEKCATSASILYRLNLRGFLGAFVLEASNYGNFFHSPICCRALPAHRCSRQFCGSSKKSAGE
jgi:cytochrome c-type biogenesis protein